MANRRITLRLHPFARPSVGVEGVHAGIARKQNQLIFRYRLDGNLALLRLPKLAAPVHADGLWQHTCFEAFVGVRGSAAYYEFNFSPSRQWAVYEFRSYRDGVPLRASDWAPELSVRYAGNCLELEAVVPLEPLAWITAGARLHVGLTAVIEGGDGELSYWALKHPADKPDFHHPESFLLQLALGNESA
ncbi:MAG: DOMON-like domain-containing protein [Deltaproteobacteria bacterium]|nr:DOMON-like domain-containing protein [Deltaproteobacteria bacterium]